MGERVYSPEDPLSTRLASFVISVLAQPSGVLWHPLGLDRLPAGMPVMIDSVVWALAIGAILGIRKHTKKQEADNQNLEHISDSANAV